MWFSLFDNYVTSNWKWFLGLHCSFILIKLKLNPWVILIACISISFSQSFQNMQKFWSIYQNESRNCDISITWFLLLFREIVLPFQLLAKLSRWRWCLFGHGLDCGPIDHLIQRQDTLGIPSRQWTSTGQRRRAPGREYRWTFDHRFFPNQDCSRTSTSGWRTGTATTRATTTSWAWRSTSWWNWSWNCHSINCIGIQFAYRHRLQSTHWPYWIWFRIWLL